MTLAGPADIRQTESNNRHHKMIYREIPTFCDLLIRMNGNPFRRTVLVNEIDTDRP